MNLTNVNEITYICGFFISENSSFIKKKKPTNIVCWQCVCEFHLLYITVEKWMLEHHIRFLTVKNLKVK